MKLLIATHNPAKLKELLTGLNNLRKKRIDLMSLSDFHINKNPAETGKTFQENSLLKAKFYANLSGLPTVADDGGLGIYVLHGQPGVTSRRWTGSGNATDSELIQHTLNVLRRYRGKKRAAYLQTCVTFYDPKTQESFSETEKIEGTIAQQPSGRPTDGYPFRALFIVKKFDTYYDELTPKEHAVINHRFIALHRLSKTIERYLLQ